MSNLRDKPVSYWKDKLTPEQFKILREGKTEPAFTGVYVDNKAHGEYRCAGCSELLFTSETKFDSKSGWPSFWEVVSEGKVELKKDFKLATPRVEVSCATCGGHLGHLFDDGPKPTGKRYCINSAALSFKRTKEEVGPEA